MKGTNLLRIIAFDPGSSSSGWARIDVRWGLGLPVTCTFVAKGKVANDVFAAKALVARDDVDMVAIEQPEAYAFKRQRADGTQKQYGASMVGYLMAARGVSDQLKTLAMLAGKTIVEVPATRVRRLLCGRGSVKDATVKNAVTRLVAGWPARSNDHERDAAACGVAAAWLTASRQGAKVGP